MLKFTFTDRGPHLEVLTSSLEDVVTQRILLALRTGDRLRCEPSHASFLVPLQTPALQTLRLHLQWVNEPITLCQSDRDSCEITLRGVWMTSQCDLAASSDGILFVSPHPITESLIWEVWQATFPASTDRSRDLGHRV